METIRSYLNELIELRTDEIGNGVSIQDEYRAKSKRLQLLFNEMLQCLPKDKQSKLYQYEELGNERISKVYSIMYRQGLMDGIHITALIDEGRKFDNELSQKCDFSHE
ncbi:hypothetical protein EHV15_11245 [Paenibacillus oralis]|uniref:Uncharacterized protein n=1 Tax=Paenibacillus oralis TaxID=2490856 RepID=A0A3P3U046_9BACL|nr:hypothetical protein [Paenibacillus oralis]RRJ63434.1 hypothetical protein EHV15_11245 [Paenibacillus oralis]